MLAETGRHSTNPALQRANVDRPHPILLATLAETYVEALDELVQLLDQALAGADSLLDEAIDVLADPAVPDDEVGRLIRACIGMARLQPARRPTEDREPRDHGHFDLLAARYSPDMAAVLAAVEVLRQLNSSGRTTVPDEATSAAATSFVPTPLARCRYVANEELRRRVRRQLNKGESLHALRHDLFFAHQVHVRRRHLDDQVNQALCLTLVTNAAVLWTTYLGDALDALRRHRSGGHGRAPPAPPNGPVGGAAVSRVHPNSPHVRHHLGMALWIPTPRDVLGAAGATVSWTVDTVVFVAVLPARVAMVLTDVEVLVGRISGVADDAAALLSEMSAVLQAAALAVDGALDTVRRASGVIEGAEATVAGAGRVIEGSEATVAGAGRVIEGAEATVAGAGRVIEGAEATVAGAARVIAGSEATVAGAARVIDSSGLTVHDAARTIAEAGRATTTALELLATWQPIAEQAAPLAGRFVREFSEEELQAAINAVDQLPGLANHLKSDVMPLLATLDRAGPDIHELLDVAKDVREAIAGIPGFTFFRKRGEHKLD